MNDELILQPMLGMMALTAIVWLVMYAKRIPAMKKAGVPVQAYTTPDKAVELLPEAVNNSANNFKNLFELPVLFYGLCLFLYVTDGVDTGYVIAAWLFLAFRIAHSFIHCTSNIVMLRFYLYLAAALALWFMLGRALAGSMLA
ncbi:MAG: MAPEG family protein [Gammaproteobacteria bacterium]|nr:MAPEG family protein [Gammaproteobacteria bacterium]MDH3362531.1 MAPEG family protein [Gammaproteobacteria bacterium]MDH3480321.1 MAPEG family protein [Gammaproteobacteria bacterium]